VTVFVHSLWSVTPLPFGLANFTVAQVLNDFEASAGSDPGIAVFTRTEQIASTDLDESWARPTGDNWVAHLTAVYVLDTEAAGLQLQQLPGRTVIGAVSDLPAANSDLMDQLRGSTQGQIIEPDLRLDRLTNLRVYEARVVTDTGERSITYADPDHAASHFAEDWAGDSSLTAATIQHDDSVLLTAFADGQIWLGGVAPEAVPEVVSATVSRLWRPQGMAAL
jgi:hypothetical protein